MANNVYPREACRCSLRFYHVAGFDQQEDTE